MVSLIAIHAIRRREPVKKAGGKKFNSVTINAGETFSEDDEKEALRLIGLGAARQAPAPLPPIGGKAPQADPLEKLTDAELATMAADRNVQLKEGATRAEMIAALKAA
ncbi:hypothetical protein [Bradyrhizobium retamae]|uniref:Uncharacterized protein n=1 Tax=Bradyrhizobium retamae TaxID=1300035 RepID=A0A0R3MJG7_9BRAD|nr:hypothetical protein [Bradyrhizobium retamae]KRR16870.1 hypothetical protein CQ13_36550 [Bradyrhizobium retamae]